MLLVREAHLEKHGHPIFRPRVGQFMAAWDPQRVETGSLLRLKWAPPTWSACLPDIRWVGSVSLTEVPVQEPLN